MKKRISIILAFLVVLFATINCNSVFAQVFIATEEEETFSDRIGDHGLDPGWFDIPAAPDPNSGYDYTPIGNGIWLLGCLGGAYLLGKRRKKENE